MRLGLTTSIRYLQNNWSESIGYDQAYALFGFVGSISPGLILRQVDTTTDESALFPTLVINAKKDNHSLAYTLAYNRLDRQASRDEDVETMNHTLLYGFRWRQHNFSFELANERRMPLEGEDTDSLKIGFLWTYNFRKSARPVSRPPKEPIGQESIDDASIDDKRDRPVEFIEFTPGREMAELEERLAATDIRGIEVKPGLISYETVLMEQIDQRQRLAVIHEAGLLKKTALIIDFEDVGWPEEMLATYRRVQGILLIHFGHPDNHYEKGVAEDSFVDGVNQGTFVRITEWEHPRGTIRFGIPRRLDRRVRMEVQFAKRFPPVTETLWSIEEVR